MIIEWCKVTSLNSIIFREWPKMYVGWRYLDGRWRLYELSLLAAFPWFLCPILLAGVDSRIDSLVPWEQLKINNTFEIPPNTQHNLLLMNIGFWCRLCRFISLPPWSFSNDVIVNNPFFIARYDSLRFRFRFVSFQQWIANGNLFGELNFVQFVRNPNIELINVKKLSMQNNK